MTNSVLGSETRDRQREREQRRKEKREESEKRVPLVVCGHVQARKVAAGLGIRTAKGSHPFVLHHDSDTTTWTTDCR